MKEKIIQIADDVQLSTDVSTYMFFLTLSAIVFRQYHLIGNHVHYWRSRKLCFYYRMHTLNVQSKK